MKVPLISKFITQLFQIIGRKFVYISLFKSLLFLTSNYSHAVVTSIGGVGTADIPATWSTSVSGDTLTATNASGSIEIKWTYIASQPDYWTVKNTSLSILNSVLESQLDRMERDRIKEWLDLALGLTLLTLGPEERNYYKSGGESFYVGELLRTLSLSGMGSIHIHSVTPIISLLMVIPTGNVQGRKIVFLCWHQKEKKLRFQHY